MKFKVASLLIFSLVIFICGFYVGQYVEGKALGVDSKDLIPTVATLFAAFAGAWFAFELNRKEKDSDKSHAKISAANRALFILLQQFNELLVLQKKVIEPYRAKPGRHLEMPAIMPRNYDHLKFDSKALEFFLDTKHRQLLPELFVEEARFHEAINCLNERSNIHINQFQPLMEKAGMLDGGTYSNQDFEAVLGTRLYSHLKRSTDSVIFHVDETVKSLHLMGEMFRDALKDLFPTSKFIRFEPKENYQKHDKA